MRLLYDMVLKSIYLIIFLTGLFHGKAKRWLQGRKGQFERIRQMIPEDKPLVWFHCASLGEFEQGRPVIEAFRAKYPDKKILLTFFSPSGYDVRKNYPGADYILYMPLDTRRNAKNFVKLTRPEMVFFIKYEYWYNFIDVLYSNKIPVFILSAVFRPEQVFFRWYGTWFRQQLKKISFFFVQNERSASLLSQTGMTNYTISGDTRFDRVYAVVRKPESFQTAETFRKEHSILLAGSTWPQDEDLLVNFINNNQQDLRFIIAPHEINEARITQLQKRLTVKSIRYTMTPHNEVEQAKVLIIDTIGMLTYLYRYAAIAYIGGGFGTGIHNILEAAAFGIPVVFGPNFRKFQEAIDLINSGGAFSIKNSKELTEIINKLLSDNSFYSACAKINHDYISGNVGATEKIVMKIPDFLNRHNDESNDL
jgi:3-deoxy-D-manno-octulosonic-acid transferase